MQTTPLYVTQLGEAYVGDALKLLDELESDSVQLVFLLQIANMESNSLYLQRCKAAGTAAHPARFPQKLPAFFIQFLTEPGDTALDFFAGSNTTGAAAEAGDAGGLRSSRIGSIWQRRRSVFLIRTAAKHRQALFIKVC